MHNKEIKIGAILSYIFIVINNIIGLIYTPIMLKYMGQSEYGLYSLAAAIIGYLTILDLGFGNAIIVYTSKYLANGKKEELKNLHGMFKILYTFIGIVSLVIGIILYFNIEKIFLNSMTAYEISRAKIIMLILTFNLAITFSMSIYGSIIIAYEKFIFSKILSIVRQVLNPIIMLPLLFMGYRAIAMTVVLTILNVSCLIANKIYCEKKLKLNIKTTKWDKTLLKEIFGYSFFIFLCTIADKANWSIDQVILGSISGTIVVAIYSLATQVNSIYLSFSNAITGVLIPKVTKMIESNATDKEVSEIFIKNGRIQYMILALILSGFIIFGREFILLWAGTEYNTSYIIACLLIASATITIIQDLGVAVLQAKKLVRFRSLTYIILAIFNVLVSIPLSKKMGGIGAALGTAITLFIRDTIIMNIYYYKKAKLDIPRFWKNILSISIPILFIAIIGYIINYYVYNLSWMFLFVKICIYTLLYFIVTFKLSLNNYEKDLLIKGPLNKVKKIFRVFIKSNK